MASVFAVSVSPKIFGFVTQSTCFYALTPTFGVPFPPQTSRTQNGSSNKGNYYRTHTETFSLLGFKYCQTSTRCFLDMVRKYSRKI